MLPTFHPGCQGLLYINFRATLTLIGPGEVKVDLADFDLKLQENL